MNASFSRAWGRGFGETGGSERKAAPRLGEGYDGATGEESGNQQMVTMKDAVMVSRWDPWEQGPVYWGADGVV